MPHVSEGAGGDDLDQEGTDEIKVYEDEGGEDEKRSENLTEEKSSLIDLTESEEKGGNGQTYSSTKNATRSDLSPVYGKLEPTPHSSSYSMGFLVPPYTYHNGAAAGSIPVSMASKIGLAGSHPFFCPGGDPLGQPPPAHMGIPPYQLDPKGAGITRPAMYPFSSAQYAYPMLSPDMSQVASWHSPSMYPIGSPGSGFRSPYPSSLPITNTTLSSDLYRFSPTGLIPPHPHAPHHPHPHPGLGSPHALSSHQLASSAAVVTPGPKQELGGHPGSGHPGSGHTGAHGDHNHRGRVSHRKCERFEMESVPEKWWCEQPLDLVKKKIPVAVVAPSAILKRVDDGEEAKSDQEVIKREEVDWTPKYGGLPPYDSGVGTPVGTHSLTPARRETTDIGLQGDDKISQIALQSPNLYSALCKEPISDLSEKKKETPPVSAAHMEMLDKLTAEYVQKMAVQGVPDALKPDGLYSMIHRLAALEHKFLSALYMGSLANPSLAGYSPAPGSTLPAVGLSQGLSPPLVAGMSPRVPTPTGLLGSLPLPYLSPTMLPYQNFLMPPSYSDPRQGNADSQSRLKQMFPVSPSPNSLIENSGSSTKSTEDFVSSSSSVRSSSASSPLDLALSPMSSVRASPPLTPQSSGHRRPASAKRSSMDHQKNSTTGSSESKNQDSANASNNQDKKKPHIKKPLNAFMLYMKEMRSKVVAECTLKESAAINQILGRRWHSLTREEQAKYYEKARHERQLHMQLYPAWSARDNYGYGAKKKKRKKERVPVDAVGGNNMKKCRARYGLDQQSQWCKPCRRKKKCIRYMEAVGGGGGMDDGNQSDDNLGSCGSVGDGDAHTPLDDDDHEDGDDTESMSQSHSLSSPGALSGFSSLTSPSMILPSPSTSLASPSVSLASPGMSLQSPLTPLEYDCKPPQMPLSLPLSLPMYNQHSPLLGPPLNRQKVGTNPHDINNPLSVNQLTGKCIKTEAGVSASGNGGSASGNSNSNDSSSRAIRVT